MKLSMSLGYWSNDEFMMTADINSYWLCNFYSICSAVLLIYWFTDDVCQGCYWSVATDSALTVHQQILGRIIWTAIEISVIAIIKS